MSTETCLPILCRGHINFLLFVAVILTLPIFFAVKFKRYGLIRKFLTTPEGVAYPSEQECRCVMTAVKRISRRVPGSACLFEATLGKALMKVLKRQSTIVVGVAASEEKGFEAHAWLVTATHMVLGGPPSDVRRFTPILEIL